MKIRILIFLASCFLLLTSIGCGKSVTGSNAELDVVHTGGPDCMQSGCHPGFGAGGTVFTNLSSSTPVSGVTVKANNVANLQTTTLGTTDTLGNFYYENTLNGSFQMMVGSRQSGVYLHKLPEDGGCNRCHRWPKSATEDPGKLY